MPTKVVPLLVFLVFIIVTIIIVGVYPFESEHVPKVLNHLIWISCAAVIALGYMLGVRIKPPDDPDD